MLRSVLHALNPTPLRLAARPPSAHSARSSLTALQALRDAVGHVCLI